MATYTAFVGGWDEPEPDWTNFVEKGLTWDQARERMAAHFRLFADDDCDHCQQAGKDNLEALMSAKQGFFRAEIDGNDCLIFEGDAPPSTFLE